MRLLAEPGAIVGPIHPYPTPPPAWGDATSGPDSQGEGENLKRGQGQSPCPLFRKELPLPAFWRIAGVG